MGERLGIGQTGTPGIVARVPRFRKRRSAPKRREPPSGSLASAVRGPTSRPWASRNLRCGTAISCGGWRLCRRPSRVYADGHPACPPSPARSPRHTTRRGRSDRRPWHFGSRSCSAVRRALAAFRSASAGLPFVRLIPDSEALTQMRGRFQFVDHRHRVVLNGNMAAAFSSASNSSSPRRKCPVRWPGSNSADGARNDHSRSGSLLSCLRASIVANEPGFTHSGKRGRRRPARQVQSAVRLRRPPTAPA